MAINGPPDYIITAQEIVTEALELCGVLGAGETVDSNDMSSALRTLNMMISAWNAEENFRLSALRRMYLLIGDTTIQTNTHEFDFNRTIAGPFISSFNKTRVAADAVATDTTLYLESVDNIVVNDNILYKNANNVLESNTVQSIDAVNKTVTLSSGLAANVSQGAEVYFYPESVKIYPPSGIHTIYITTYGDNSIPMIRLNFSDYGNLPIKQIKGTPNSWLYLPQYTNYKLLIWPEAFSPSDYLTVWGQMAAEQVNSANEYVGYPPEYYEALSYNLALRLSRKFGSPVTLRRELQYEADRTKEMAASFDSDPYVRFQPDLTRG